MFAGKRYQQKQELRESAAVEELQKRELARGTLFCTFDKMSFNLLWARKTILGDKRFKIDA